MPYAIYETTTGVVVGWYDMAYPTLPSGEAAIEVTEAQFAARLSNPSGWQIQNEALAAYTPPPPVLSLAQQGAALVAGGLTIASTGAPALNGTYLVAPGIAFGQEDIATEAQFVSTFAEFTNGTTTALEWPLLDGTMVTFTSTAAFLTFAKAAAVFIAGVKGAIATATALPAATATIP